MTTGLTAGLAMITLIMFGFILIYVLGKVVLLICKKVFIFFCSLNFLLFDEEIQQGEVGRYL